MGNGSGQEIRAILYFFIWIFPEGIQFLVPNAPLGLAQVTVTPKKFNIDRFESILKGFISSSLHLFHKIISRVFQECI